MTSIYPHDSQIRRFRSIRVWIHGFDDPQKLQFPRPPWQTLEKSLVLKKKERQQSALLNSSFPPCFLLLWVILPTGIRIQPTEISRDPEPQRCWKKCAVPYRSSQPKKIYTIVYKNFSIKIENYSSVFIEKKDFASITDCNCFRINQSQKRHRQSIYTDRETK